MYQAWLLDYIFKWKYIAIFSNITVLEKYVYSTHRQKFVKKDSDFIIIEDGCSRNEIFIFGTFMLRVK